jgi:cytidylate kinase
VKRLEAADSLEVIEAELIEDVRRVAEQEPEVQAAVEATAQMMQQQFGNVINQGKLAEKIGFLIQGGYNPINIDKVEL